MQDHLHFAGHPKKIFEGKNGKQTSLVVPTTSEVFCKLRASWKHSHGKKSIFGQVSAMEQWKILFTELQELSKYIFKHEYICTSFSNGIMENIVCGVKQKLSEYICTSILTEVHLDEFQQWKYCLRSSRSCRSNPVLVDP